MTDGPRLRDDLETLAALVQQTALGLRIDRTFVEKDFWVTELLRAVSGGTDVPVQGGTPAHVDVVFKGGTSLSRVYRLISRFSEDVDLLVLFPAGLGAGSRDRGLKQLVANAQQHMGVGPDRCVTQTSTKGVKRNVEFHYPRRFSNPALRDHLLLEMGSRGGPHPHAQYPVSSMVAEYATGALGEPTSTWQEFAPVAVQVLAAERTLLEKCALLHNLATRAVRDEDPTAIDYLARSGRHYYDIACLLEDDTTRQALTAMGSAGVAQMAADIDAASQAAGWRFEPRPSAGYAASAAFGVGGACHDSAAAAYETALAMVYGEAPPFEDVLRTVATYAHLL